MTVPYIVSAPVQADRTGDSLAELNRQINEFLTTRGVTPEELKRVVTKNINQLPGEFELATSFRFGGTPFEVAESGLRLYAKEVLPVVRSWPRLAG